MWEKDWVTSSASLTLKCFAIVVGMLQVPAYLSHPVRVKKNKNKVDELDLTDAVVQFYGRCTTGATRDEALHCCCRGNEFTALKVNPLSNANVSLMYDFIVNVPHWDI